jgi:hypothetical protein
MFYFAVPRRFCEVREFFQELLQSSIVAFARLRHKVDTWLVADCLKAINVGVSFPVD